MFVYVVTWKKICLSNSYKNPGHSKGGHKILLFVIDLHTNPLLPRYSQIYMTLELTRDCTGDRRS